MKTLMKMAVCGLAVVVMAGCASGGGGGASDTDIIQGIINDAMTALKAQDIDAMVSNYSDDFESDQGGGVAEMKEFLSGAQEQGFLDGIEIDMAGTEINVEGEKATAGPIDLEGAFGALTLEFELGKRDGQWQVTYQSQY
jgi:hypothetical protein